MPSYLPELTISNTKPDGPAALPCFVLLINSHNHLCLSNNMSFPIPYKLCSITSHDNVSKLFIIITDHQHTVIIPYTLLTTDILFNLFRFRKNITIILNLYEQKIITQHHCLYTTNYILINLDQTLCNH